MLLMKKIHKKNYEDLNEIKPVDNKNKDDNKKSKEKKILNKKGNIRRVLKPDLGYNYTFDGTESTSCSCCGNKMYKSTPVKRVIIVTLNKIQTEEHTAETLRCNICNVTKTAPLPEKINQNFGRYHYSTVAHLISLRYAYGVASYRIEQVSQNVGLKISDSTQWYIFEQAASVLRTFFSFLKKFAANSKIIHADDTHVKVLSLLKDIEEAQDDAISQGKNPDNVRRGIHTTNITAIFNDEKNKGEIVLFDSGLHHCGEIIAELLENRIIGAEVVLMSDASSSNTSKLDDLKNDVDVKNVNCNSHAMRKFKEIKKSLDAIQKIAPILKNETSDRCEFYLSTYKEIFDNDLISRNFSNEERLKFHFEKSYPLMLAMKSRIEQDFHHRKVEPNSGEGKDYQYFLNHFEKLCGFCLVLAAPICNNKSERMLKCIILMRKNSLFFKNELGAFVADIFTSILFTAKQNKLNPIEYLTDLLIFQKHWKKDPERWLPWNYLDTISLLK